MPESIEALFTRARNYRIKNMLVEASDVYQKILQNSTDNEQAHFEYGDLLKRRGKITQAIEHLELAIELKSGFAQAHSSLGGAYRLKGLHVESERNYCQAVELNPADFRLHSNLLMSQLYTDKLDSEAKFSEYTQWSAQHTSAIPVYTNHTNSKDNHRALRIGYVSGDFRRHPVAFFIIPVLATHNKSTFHTFAYSQSMSGGDDPVNKIIRSMVPNWRDVADWDDSRLAEQIRADGIDILIDLSGHSGSNRLLMFARRPAPVQVTWLGYPASTGLDAIDYRITDAWADPVGVTDKYYSESLIRLPTGFSCFIPSNEAPPVGPLPFHRNGYITFGSFNNMSKITAEVISVWAQLLTEVDGSRLILKNYSLNDDGVSEHCRQQFANHGINPDRLSLIANVTDYGEHLGLYNQIDIALDTFPYNGTTTTCEALWMGAPVISLIGNSHVSRVGCSLLSRIGLTELLTENTSHYIETSKQLAVDITTLDGYRQTLRQKMQTSSICQFPQFTHALESEYRNMWNKWCDS